MASFKQSVEPTAEVGKEIYMGLAMVFWQRAVIAGDKGVLEHTVWLVVIIVIQVGKAHAEYVIVPGEVAFMHLHLVLVFYVFPMKSTICSHSVWAGTEVSVCVQRIHK